MSDISNQLIKDSYNYVLQSDLSTGVVYRIGGLIPVNPIFQSGLTVTGGFTYSGAGEQVGYALLTDGTGYAYWGPVSAATPSSGVTSITVGNGLSANTSTGNVTIVFTGSTNVSGLTYYVTGSTPTGGSFISGDRWFNIITGDELVYINDGDSQQWIQICCGSGGGGGGGSSAIQGITGITGTSGVSATTTDFGTTIINTAPDQTVTITGGTNIEVTGTYPNFGVNFTGTTGSNFTGGTVTGPTNFTNGLTANTISATTYQNLPSSFQSVRINNTTQFSANTGNFINFSGINITITSAATNTLVFSAGTGGSGSPIAIYNDNSLLTSNPTSITFTGAGVTASAVGNDVTVIIPGGGGGGTTLIASSSCVVTPNSTIYIGNQTYGWNDTSWDLNDTSFSYPNTNCGVPLPINITSGNTIEVCGIAYNNDTQPTKQDFYVYLYNFGCDVRDGLVQLDTVETLDAFDVNGLYCFNLQHTLTQTLSACTNFLSVGFSSTAEDGTQLRISYTIKTT
jgi:hypothetical protein